MVRFHWHVEDGLSAYVPPGGLTGQKDTDVKHAACEIEVGSASLPIIQVRARTLIWLRRTVCAQIPGQKETLPALLTVPPSWLHGTQASMSRCSAPAGGSSIASCSLACCFLQPKEVGIILGHGSTAAEWKGKFLTELASYLAGQGASLGQVETLHPVLCIHAPHAGSSTLAALGASCFVHRYASQAAGRVEVPLPGCRACFSALACIPAPGTHTTTATACIPPLAPSRRLLRRLCGDALLLQAEGAAQAEDVRESVGCLRHLPLCSWHQALDSGRSVQLRQIRFQSMHLATASTRQCSTKGSACCVSMLF